MKDQLIEARNQFQALLDNYQITGTALDPFKNAMVSLDNIIAAPAETPVPAVVLSAPAPVSADDIAQGVCEKLLPIFQNMVTLLTSAAPPVAAVVDQAAG